MQKSDLNCEEIKDTRNYKLLYLERIIYFF